ncbi:MAG: metalloregulator ArsR/SmtB family transcription factor [Peptococcaceae bacterium]|jgi:arsenate reductase|nr:metalloregulator ArsR/SmtB family transcription factor [Peptococcaceae bacterium]
MDTLHSDMRLLGDVTRLRVLRLLAERPLSVNDLQTLLNVSQSGVSQQLAKLRSAGWVYDERVGQHVFYCLNTQRIPQVVGQLQRMFQKPLPEIPLLSGEWSRWRAMFGEPTGVSVPSRNQSEAPASRGRPLRVVFLCVGNSCRSQMAEGFARVLGTSRLQSASAGLEPAGVHPMAVTVMAEAGIDISRHTSKAMSPGLLDGADLLVTLCGAASGWRPATAGEAAWRYWPLPDPARVTGPRYRRVQAFRQVRDLLHTRVERLVAEASGGLGRVPPAEPAYPSGGAGKS